MALDFNLNEPYNDSDTVVAGELLLNENIVPSPIDLNLQPDDYADGAVVVVADESLVNESRILLPIDLNAQPSNEECIFDMNVFTPLEDESVNVAEDVIGGNEIDDRENQDDTNAIGVDTGDLLSEEDDDLSYLFSEEDEDMHGVLFEEGNNINETQPSRRKRCFLDNNQRQRVSELLLHSCRHGKFGSETIKRIASQFSVSKDVIYRIWRQIKETGQAYHKKTQNCGRKRVQIDFEKIREVSLAKRSTLRSLQIVLGIKSKTTLLKYVKEGVLRRHSNVLKPHLKDNNMKARLEFCLSMLEDSSIPRDPMFKPMYNVVHIDEKWFFVTKKSSNYYLLANEDEPYRTCTNKNYIGKVMFLVAVARPRFDDEGNETFSGKIGVFPLVTKVPAKRSSINRMSGTLETKPITSITKEVSRIFLINKVLPAIKEKWPREHAHETIYIQQDNAPCHVPLDDQEFCRAASEGGFDIRLTFQPPNSPDLNVLDLGFFAAIQSLQQKEVTNSVDALILAVEKSYENYSSKSLNKIFLTLQSCMVEIMKAKGSNHYKIPHLKKDMLLNRGILPAQLKCDPELFREVLEYLHNVRT